MKIQQVQPNTTFQSKEGLLSVGAHNNLKLIAERMKEANSYKTEGKYTSTRVLERLEIYKDQKPVAHLINQQRYNSSYDFLDDVNDLSLQIGKKQVILDSYRGHYICDKKPFFHSWKKYIKTIEELLEYILTNYNSTNIVHKRFFDKSNIRYF